MKLTKKNIALLLRIAVAAGACYFVFHDLNLKQMAAEFGRIRLWVIFFAVSVYYLCQVGMAFRWWLLLRNLDIVISFITALNLHFHGLFFSNFLPSSMGGDFIRAWYVSRHTRKRFQSAMSVFVDRLIGLVSTLIIAIVTYFLFLRGKGIFGSQPQQESSGLNFLRQYQKEILFFVFLSIFVLMVCLLIPFTRRVIFKLFWRLRYLSTRAVSHFLEVVLVFYRKPWIGPSTFLITVFFQSLMFLSFWLLGCDLQVSDQIWYYFAFFPLVWVLGSMPVSIAGLGILEGGIKILFVNFAGASPESAAALALCQRAVILLGSLPGIWIHLRAEYLPKRADEFFIDAGSSLE